MKVQNIYHNNCVHFKLCITSVWSVTTT